MTTNQDNPNTAGAAEPVAWMYNAVGFEGQCAVRRFRWDYVPGGWTETPLYAHPPENPRPSATLDAYAVMNPQSGGVSAPSTGQLYNASAVPDEVVEAMGEALFALSDRLRASGFLISDFNHASYERVVKAWGVLTAAIPAIRAQVVADERARIVDWLEKQADEHEKLSSAWDVLLDTADAIEQGAHDNG